MNHDESGKTAPNLPGEDPWGWIDDRSGIYHAVFHCGNGATMAGCHRWSDDGGVHWHGGDEAGGGHPYVEKEKREMYVFG